MTSENTRVLYDHGVQNWGNHNFNLYGSFGFVRDWSKYNFKLGVALIEKNVTVDNRVRLTNDHNVTLYHRTTGRSNDLRFGLIGVVDLTKRKLIKKDLLLGFERNNVDVSLKAQQPFEKATQNFNNWREWFETFTLTTLFKRNQKERYGVEVVANPTQNLTTFTGLVEYKYHDRGLTRIKFDNNLNLTVLIKNTLTDKLSLSVGASIPIKR